MSDLQLRQFDLNLLRVFDALWATRSVTQAAERLCITPSAVSHAMNKLRALLNDELFRRGSGKMQPTPLAADLGPRVHAALCQLHLSLSPSDFAPHTTQRQFQVAATPYASWTLMPLLMPHLRRAAPKASVHFIRYEVQTLEALDSGLADLALGPFDYIPDRFDHCELFSDDLVWVMGQAAAADLPDSIGMERIADIQPIQVATANTSIDQAQGGLLPGMFRADSLMSQGNLDDALAEFGLKRRAEISVPNMITAFATVSASDCGMLSLRRLAAEMARLYPLKLFELPHGSAPLQFRLVWKSGDDTDPSIAWLTRLMKEVVEASAIG